MKTSVALLLLISLLPIRAAGAEKPNDVAGFKVNIPEGLYLYQPWTNDVAFAPLFMVRDGKLLNPYELYGAKERGYRGDERTEEEKKALDSFMRENVIGKSFNIYVGAEKYGVLSEVDFRNNNYCDAKIMLSDIRGEGNYKGKRFTGGTQDESLYIVPPDELHLQMEYGSLKAVAMPSSYVKSIKNRPLTLTEEDKTKVVASVRKELLSAAMESMSVFFRPPYHSDVKVIMEKGSRLDSL